MKLGFHINKTYLYAGLAIFLLCSILAGAWFTLEQRNLTNANSLKIFFSSEFGINEPLQGFIHRSKQYQYLADYLLEHQLSVSQSNIVTIEENQTEESVDGMSCYYRDREIKDGDTITLYEDFIAKPTEGCRPQTRLCHNGTLSGSFEHEHCVVDYRANLSSERRTGVLDCRLYDFTIADEDAIVAYADYEVPYNQSCQAQMRLCLDGNLSGSYIYDRCRVLEPQSCVFEDKTIAHGDSIVLYADQTDDSCSPQRRWCEDGNLTGDPLFRNKDCSIEHYSSLTTSVSGEDDDYTPYNQINREPSTEACQAHPIPQCSAEEILTPGIVDKEGCPGPLSCVSSQDACPVYPIPQCGHKETFTPGEIDSRGCQGPSRCTVGGENSFCHLYAIPRCEAGETLSPGIVDRWGCPGPLVCVPQGQECPIYPITQCAKKETFTPGDIGQDGCQEPSTCVSGQRDTTCITYPIPQCAPGESLNPGIVDRWGCPGPLSCVATDKTCPVHSIPNCSKDQRFLAGEIDSDTGCQAPSVCLDRGFSCPVYPIPECAAGEILSPGNEDVNGCYSALTCVSQ